MATFAKINDWMLNLHNSEADMNADVLEIALATGAPSSESPDPTTDGNGIATNITPISYTNYSDDMGTNRLLETISSTQTSGVYKLDADDIIITASGGALASFQYLYLFNQTVATPTDPIIGVWNHGSAIILASGESATITWNAAGIYTVT